MDRLFLDANVLFSAAYRPNAGLLKLWKLKDVVLCSSNYALEEARFNLLHEIQRSRLAKLSAHLQLFDAIPRELPRGVSLPAKDAPVLLAAIEAKATHLITGDLRHFGPYFGKIIEGILVLTPAAYLKAASRST
jgi:predicted nucleic acid-binding protein